MNQPGGGGPQHGGGVPQHGGGAPSPYVDNPVPRGGAVNPYAAPQHWGYAVQPGRGGPRGEWVACPRCQSPYVNKSTFTWWGGLVGPLIIPEVKCATCGNTFNGKTGGPLTGAIALYLAVVLGGFFVVAAVVVFLLATQF